MTSYRDLVRSAKTRTSEISPEALEARLAEFVLIDVREAGEHEQGALRGARLLPRGILERDIAAMIPDSNRRLLGAITAKPSAPSGNPSPLGSTMPVCGRCASP